MQRTSAVNTAAAIQNQLSWYSLDNRHRIQLTSTLRYEAFTQDLSTNTLGNYYYNSLADLEAGRPTMYTRTLSPQIRRGGQVLGGLSVGDAFRVRPDFQLQYGVRLDANRFLQAPERNTLLASAFTLSNDVLPQRVYISPRIGFSWTYGEAAQLAVGEGFARGPRAIVRGGVGVFQNTPNAQLIANALSNTGVPGATSQLTCLGSAVPAADWSGFASGTTPFPSACADGSTGSALVSRAPDVWMFGNDYAAQRSVRANINWSGAALANRLLATLDATYSTNLNQSGADNANFNPAVRFTLGNEGNRPIFATLSGIVPTTGAVTPSDARINAALGAIMTQRSDLRSLNRQLSVSVQPLAFSSVFNWSLGYVYSSTSELLRGFASTAGDPRAREWSRGALDANHQLSYGIAYNFFDWVPVSLTGSFRSGRPFTPLVGSDINGDGFRNDRAFVFDPAASVATDPAVTSGMRQLLERGSPRARTCLARQLGTLASRASCEEPWSSTSNLTIGFNPMKFGFPQRLNVSLYVNNPLGAADMLINGEAGRKGWGQAINPDPVLLYVRGFDAAAKQFRYEVNPRFGSTSPRETVNRNPIVVTAQFRIDVGYTRERQLLTQSLDRGRSRSGARSTEQDIRGMSGTLIPQNPMTAILRRADTLRLTRRQADTLSALNRSYALAYDSIWSPVAKYLTALPKDYPRASAYDRYRQARERTIDLLLRLAPIVNGVLTDEQRRVLPVTTTASLDRRYLAAVRSSTAGGANLGALGLLAQLGWNGGTVDPSAAAVMIHR